MNFSHFFIYYLFLFTGILILFAFLLNQRAEDALFWVLLGSFLIIFVPVIDFIVSKGRGFRLSYILDEPVKNFLTGFNPFSKSPDISPGQKIIFLSGSMGGAVIIFYKTKDFLKAIIFPLILYLWTFFTGLVPLLISYFLKSNFSEIFKTGGLFVSDTQKFSILFFLFLQVNIFTLYFLKNCKFKFLRNYDFLRDFIVFLTPLIAGILLFKYLLTDLYLSVFINKFDYFIFPAFFLLSFYLTLFRKFIYDEKKSFFLISGTLLIFFSMSFGYVAFYLVLLNLFLIYISKEMNFKFYIWLSPLILIFASSSIISHTKSFILFTPEFCIFILLFSILISFFEVKNKKIWLLISFLFYLSPLLFYFSLKIFLSFVLFFGLSLIFYKFLPEFKNYPSLLYFIVIIFLILPLSFKKEDYVREVSLANFYFSQKNFKKVMEYSPQDISLSYMKGISCFKMSKDDSAIKYLEKHLKIKPLDMEIYSYLVFSLVNSGRIIDAYKLNRRAFKIFSARPEVILQKGIILLNMGFLEDSERFLIKSLQIGYERPITYSYLGMLYLKKREFKRAKFYLKKSLELEPGNKFVRNMLESIS